MYPKLRLRYKNYTTGEAFVFRRGNKLLKLVDDLRNYEKYHVRFEFHNFKRPKYQVKHSMNDTGVKIKTLVKCLIEDIERHSK